MATHSPAANPFQLPLDFTGPGYDPAQDHARLVGLLRRVYEYLQDGQWHTTAEVAGACQGSETGTAAMIRKLRRPSCGGHVIERRRAPEGPMGLWQFRLRTP